MSRIHVCITCIGRHGEAVKIRKDKVKNKKIQKKGKKRAET